MTYSSCELPADVPHARPAQNLVTSWTIRVRVYEIQNVDLSNRNDIILTQVVAILSDRVDLVMSVRSRLCCERDQAVLARKGRVCGGEASQETSQNGAYYS